MIAFKFLKDQAENNNWDKNIQIITACEFITSLDKDIEFNDFLENKTKEDNFSQNIEK